MYRFVAIALLMIAFAGGMSVHAYAAQEVSQLKTMTSTPVVGDWYRSDIINNGEASLVDLTGVGGGLESNLPLSPGALKLTTGFDNADKAEVGTFADFGDAATVLAALNLSYSYYKETVAGGNQFAAPAIKIGIANNATHSNINDSYGQLIYEPYWNQPGGGAPPAPADAWQTVLIDPTTGGTDGTNTGGWWWSGGFEIANGAGGPPLKSLDEWIADFTAADAADFAGARVVSISFAVGTYNPGQIGYVDELIISGTSADGSYNFVPEPTSLVLLGLGGLGLLARRRGRSA